MASIYHTTRFWIVIIFLSVVLGTCAVTARLFDSTGNLSHRVSSLWARLLCEWNGVKVHIEGLEHVQTERAQIFISNHQSFFDIFTLGGYLPVQIRWVAKASLFKIPFVGWSMWASRYIAVLRTDRKNAYKAFLASIEQLKAGNSIVIFPEGTRSEDGTVKEFKKGGHLMCVRSKAPLVPVTVCGTGNLIRKGSGVFRPGPVHVKICPPLEFDIVGDEKEEKVMQELRETVVSNLSALQKPG